MKGVLGGAVLLVLGAIGAMTVGGWVGVPEWVAVPVFLMVICLFARTPKPEVEAEAKPEVEAEVRAMRSHRWERRPH